MCILFQLKLNYYSSEKPPFVIFYVVELIRPYICSCVYRRCIAAQKPSAPLTGYTSIARTTPE